MVQDLYVLMITAAVVSIVFKFLKQPVVLGYIVAGVLIGPNLFGETLVNAVRHTYVTKHLVNLMIKNMSAHDDAEKK